MCTKIPYATRWLAERVLLKLQVAGRMERSVHPCFADHPGSWHITSKKSRRW